MIVNITTIDDSDPENFESFTATLSNAIPLSVVVISQPQAIVIIEHNDGEVAHDCTV